MGRCKGGSTRSGGSRTIRYNTKSKMKNLPAWISAISALIAIPISVWGILVAKRAENAVSNFTNVRGPAGIVQSGGNGHFNVGELKVGEVAEKLIAREFGLEQAK